ncbi:MAG: hypothetical protein ACTHK5_12545 [Tsuneonella sp.]
MAELKTQAQAHRAALLDIVVAYIVANPHQTNAEIASALGLESSYLGEHRNHLSHSLLGEALAKGLITRTKDGSRVRYVQA